MGHVQPALAQVRHWLIGDLEVVAASRRGATRGENQDAFAVHAGPPLRVGVFDGVGGMPNGAQAAVAAARHLGSRDLDIVPALHAAVRATGGATTAAVAELHDHRITFTLVGDSAVYRLVDPPERVGRAHLVGGRLTQALGVSG